MKYYSQYKQDYWVDKLLGAKSSGVFLDIGANDGVTISNTYFFEKNRGWKGICVEPITDVYNKLVNNRHCEAINACVSDKRGKEVFFRIDGFGEMLSGIKSEYHESHWKRIMKDVESEGDQIVEYEVECLPVNDILEKFNYSDIDFLSVDTEGSELKILQAIDFNRFHFSIICVENPYNEKGFENLLNANGFELCKILSCDYLFINKKDSGLYKKARPYILSTKVQRALPISTYFRKTYNGFKQIVKRALRMVGLRK